MLYQAAILYLCMGLLFRFLKYNSTYGTLEIDSSFKEKVPVLVPVFPQTLLRSENTTGLSCYIPVTALLLCISQPSNCIDFKQVNTLHFYLHFLTCLKSIHYITICLMISYIEERNNVTHTDDSPFGHYFLAHHQKIMLFTLMLFTFFWWCARK